MEQWFFRTTAYADRLLEDLDLLQGWPERVRIMQEHWIGKSVGADVTFTLPGHEEGITVFTTRPDTLYGVSFMVLAPEHPLVSELAGKSDHEQEILAFVENATAKAK